MTNVKGSQGAQSVLAKVARSPDCSKFHEAIVADKQLWSGLKFQGIQTFGLTVFELRPCPRCESTLNRPTTLAEGVESVLESLQVLSRSVDLIHAVVVALTQAASNGGAL